MRTVKNIAANALRPGYLHVMGHKVIQRVLDTRHRGEREKATAWAKERVVTTASFAAALAPELWGEADKFGKELRHTAEQKLAASGMSLDEGADCSLLYFLVRLRSPLTVVETGVAAGFSSQAILKGLAKNDANGRLLSSDFPYFRLESPERFVGVLVDDEFRDKWELLLDGDRKNIPALLNQINAIDLMHYDSDKSYEGRKFVMDALENKLGADTVIVMDDIQDNLFFRDYVTRRKLPYRVFFCTDKYLGLIGL